MNQEFTEVMTLVEYLPTSASIAVENYPYGYRLKTTLTNTMEFNPKKGYRIVTQTIDPKTGRLNAPKKSTYYPLLVRYYDDIGHIKTKAFHFNGDKEINEGCRWIAEHFELFTIEEVEYFYSTIALNALVDMKATAIYCGSKVSDLSPFYIDFLKVCDKGKLTGNNLFASLVLDSKGIDDTKQKDFNPFIIK